MDEYNKINIKGRKEINKDIKNYISELDKKKVFLNSFKKRFFNNIKTNTITLKIITLSNLLNQFENTIKLSLEIILSYQDIILFNNKQNPLKIESPKETIKSKKKISNGNASNYMTNNSDNNFIENFTINHNNSKRIELKTNLIEGNKKDCLNKTIKNKFNYYNKQNNSHLFKNYSFSKNNNNIQSDRMPYHLYLKNQLSNLIDNKNQNLTKFHENDKIDFFSFPSLKEKTLKTLYNYKYINSEKNNITNINNLNIVKYHKNFNNLQLDQTDAIENKLNEIRAKTPIRKALRSLIKEKKFSNNSCNQARNKNNNDINNDGIGEELIQKIKKVEKIKKFFSEKYGGCKFCNFLKKYKKGQLNINEIKNEFDIISSMLELKEKKKNKIKNINKIAPISKENLLSDSEVINKSKSPIGIRKKILIHKYKNKNNINIDNQKNKKNNKDADNYKSNIPSSRFNNIEELIKSFNNY